MNRTLFVNGPILTMESPVPTDALLVENGRIMALGTDALNATGATKVDLQGDALLPAFVDPHSHLSAAANSLLQVPLGEVCDFAQLEEAVASFIRDHHIPAGQWVFGQGYDHNHLTEHAHPTRELLDKAAPNNPVVIQHASGHMGVFNSAALHQLFLTGSTPDPEGGTFGRNGGELTGYAEENAFVNNLRKAPMPGFDQLKDAFARAQHTYAAHGITTAQEGMMAAELFPLYQGLLAQNALTLDVVGYPGVADLHAARVAFPDSVNSYHNGLRLGGVKIFLDGSPQGRTAWLRTPYQGETEYRGYPTMTDEQVQEALTLAAEEGVQILAHCNGDAAAQQYLDMGAKVMQSHPNLRDVRPVIIHAQLLGVDQLPQAKALGFTPSFFVAHVYHWGDIHLQNLGAKRAAAISPAKAALDLGMPFTFHQDTPVIPCDMLETIWCAVNRITKNGVQLGPEQRIPVYEALKAVTVHAAWQYGEEQEKGSLAVGKQANLVRLSANPLEVRPEVLREVSVVSTWKQGEVLYQG